MDTVAYQDYFSNGIPGSEYIWVVFIIVVAALTLYKFKKMISDI
jgi:hypothetical protein